MNYKNNYEIFLDIYIISIQYKKDAKENDVMKSLDILNIE